MIKVTISDERVNSFTAEDRDSLLREVSSTMAAVLHKRIHQAGKKADDSLIDANGYSNEYLKRRMKAPYNRTSSRKVILSLTKGLELGFSFGVSGSTGPRKEGDGSYTLGFYGPESAEHGDITNHELAGYLEERYGPIWAHTKAEKKMVIAIADDFIKRKFGSI